MGSLWFDRNQLLEFLAELIGTKLGLVIGNNDLDRFLASSEDSTSVTTGLMRMRSETVEDLARRCLEYFGDPDAHYVGFSPLVSRSVLRAFDDFPQAVEVMSYAIKELGDRLAAGDGQTVEVDDVLDTAEERWGSRGREVAERFFQEVNARLYTSPWTGASRTAYDSRIELRDLFSSANLPGVVQQFFEQRFIDYLDANDNEISQMHWRQFEGLVAEALVQAGLKVEIGPGRNDDGVDIRAWDPAQSEEAPALLLVQCKREKAKVEKVVVKALAADVVFEGAQVGLVATTSSWSPGARETVQARKYPLIEADGNHVRAWIRAMRTPGTGPWLAN